MCQHVEDIYYLLHPEDLEEALASPKVHWDNLEESKARKHGLETLYQGQSTLDEYMEEFGGRNAKTKRCMANLVCLCVVENLPLLMGTRVGLVKLMS